MMMMTPSLYLVWGWLLLLLACCCGCFVRVAAALIRPRDCGGAVKHVHISVGPHDATSMIISFASLSSRFSPAPVAGVRVGTQADSLTKIFHEETDSPRSYNVTTLRVAMGNNNADPTSPIYFSPYYHHVVLTGLEPSTTYFYQPVVQANEANFNSTYYGQLTRQRERRRRLVRRPYDGSNVDCPSPHKIRTFRTAPLPDSQNHRATFAILGDLGQFDHSKETLSRLLRSKHEIDAAILAGDVAYTGTDGRQWDTFFDFLDDYMAFENIPLQICPGNHDIDKYETSQEIFMAYEHRFRMPYTRPAQLGVYNGSDAKINMDQPVYPLPYDYGNSFYSWKYAGAHFVMVNVYTAMEPGSKQYKFIEKELRSVQREINPWLIVVLHTPVYNTFGLHQNDPQIKVARAHLEPLFVKHQVNIVFSGHIHAYSRTSAVSLGQVDPKGPVHITVGAGGRKCEAPFLDRDPEPWVVVRDATMFGFGMLRLHNATVAEWDWVHSGGLADAKEEGAFREYNQLTGEKEAHLEAGPPTDHVYLHNQYYM